MVSNDLFRMHLNLIKDFVKEVHEQREEHARYLRESMERTPFQYTTFRDTKKVS